MTQTPSRRAFLRRVSSAAVATAATALVPAPLPAIEPIERHGGPKFKFSLAAYSYRDLLTGKPPQLKLDDFIDDCAGMHLEGTELTSYYFPTDVTPDYLRHIKNLTFRLGLDISGTAVGNDFCHPAGPQRDEQLALVKRWVDYAEILGAPVIRIFSGSPKGTSQEDAHRLAVEGIEECCQYAGQHGIYLALENHGGLTAQADDMLRIVHDVKSPWFGVNLDTGNFHTADLYGDLAKLAPYAVNVQVKILVSGPDGKRVPSDFGRLAKILSAANYRGYIVLELEGETGDPRTLCPTLVDQLRQAFLA
jgi:sugar phosphate isomerase/epimerase